MPFTIAQLTAFWTSPAQMGLTARTRVQMAAEGLATPDDFEDFPEKEDLEGIFKQLLKPAKTPGLGANALPQEVATFVIPAKSMIRLQGVRIIVLYYKMVGRTIEPGDLLWPVVKNFVEQWKALMEKKDADVGQPPRLTKDKLVYKWLESFQQHLSEKIGVRNAPLTYLIRPLVTAPAVLLPRAGLQPFSLSYLSIEEELKFCTSHTHNLFQADNSALFQLIDRAVIGHDVSATIAPFCRSQNGRAAYNAIVYQHAGKHVWDKNVKEAMAVLATRTWTGTTSITLLQHTSMHRKAYIQLTEAAEQVPAEVPGPRQRVTYLLDSMKTVDPKVLAGMAAIEQDELVKRRDFELSVTFLLPSCPVVAKNVKAKGLGVNISSSDVTVAKAGIVTKGSTGVELRWHEPSKFKLLTKEQKVELAAWNKSNPKKDGNLKKRKADGTNAKQSKSRNELMAAMVESQTAGLTALNAKIASLTVGPPQAPSGQVSVGSTITSNPHDMSVSHEVLAERARVASVRLQSILKPPSKKDKKKNS